MVESELARSAAERVGAGVWGRTLHGPGVEPPENIDLRASETEENTYFQLQIIIHMKIIRELENNSE